MRLIAYCFFTMLAVLCLGSQKIPEKTTRFALVANGVISAPEKIKARIESFPYLVAVDGGCNHCRNMGLFPDLIIGDLDSVEQEVLAFYSEVPRRVFPRDKDKTDLEIALEEIFMHDPQEVVIYGGLGGRTDHMTGNIYLLTRYPGKVFLESDTERLFVIEREAVLECPLGQTISLIPLNGPVTGITTDGLKWELKEGTLDKHFIGISNEAANGRVTIRVQQGDLLCCINYSI